MIKFSVNQKVGKKILPSFWRQLSKKIIKVLKIKKNPEVSVAVLSSAAVKKLNFTYRGRNSVTDVLSFSENKNLPKKIQALDENYLGEIVIGYSQAQKQAQRLKHSLEQEFEILLVHGFLHLLGYDHRTKKEREKMRRLTTKIIQAK